MLTGGTALGAATGQGYSDPAGDASGGPDIRSVGVSDSGGIATFRITVTGVKVTPGGDVQQTAVGVDLDTDKDGRANYALVFGTGDTGFYWDVVQRPSGKEVPGVRGDAFLSSGNAYTFKVSSTELGGATDFNLEAWSATMQGGKYVAGDSAPDNGVWSYNLTSVKPVIGTPTSFPTAPVAGKTFAMTFPVTRSDSGAKLTSGAMTSDLTVGGVVVPHSEQFKSGTVSLHFTVPADAAGSRTAKSRVGTPIS